MASAVAGRRLKRYTAECRKIETEVAKELEEGGIKIEHGKDAAGGAQDFCWRVSMTGPAEYTVGGQVRACPYNGKTYTLELTFPEEYPFKPPLARFVPPLYHPNVEQTGANAGLLCEDFVTKFWAPTKMAYSFALHIKNLLASPDLDTAIAEDIAKEMSENLVAFETKVRSKK